MVTASQDFVPEPYLGETCGALQRTELIGSLSKIDISFHLQLISKSCHLWWDSFISK